MSDTIAGIATPLAVGGIGIVRLSGSQSIAIADKVFRAKSGFPLTKSEGYRAHYGDVYDNGEHIDECVALVFRAPKSFTGEDVVELSCHGGIYIVERVMRMVLAHGAVPAGPGEFSKRAFLNGKLDLTQAEAIMDVIGAQSDQALKAANSTKSGILSHKLAEISNTLIQSAAHMSAWADYPEDDIPELDQSVLLRTFNTAKTQLETLLNTFENARAVVHGIDTVIVGRPNVGKSTLMNLLSGAPRSIVTEVAGTTRDVIEETVRLGNVVLRLADTAGLHETQDPVEQLGVLRSKERLKGATLIFAVFDATQPLSKEDKDLVALCKNKPAIALINKIDEGNLLNRSIFEDAFDYIVEISAKKGDGQEKLIEALESLLHTNQFDPSAPLITTVRQRDGIVKAIEALDDAISAMVIGMTLDAVTVSVSDAIDALLELRGEKASDQVLDSVFSQFCVGK